MKRGSAIPCAPRDKCWVFLGEGVRGGGRKTISTRLKAARVGGLVQLPALQNSSWRTRPVGGSSGPLCCATARTVRQILAWPSCWRGVRSRREQLVDVRLDVVCRFLRETEPVTLCASSGEVSGPAFFVILANKEANGYCSSLRLQHFRPRVVVKAMRKHARTIPCHAEQ